MFHVEHFIISTSKQKEVFHVEHFFLLHFQNVGGIIRIIAEVTELWQR